MKGIIWALVGAILVGIYAGTTGLKGWQAALLTMAIWAISIGAAHIAN
jgi:hypothetical protein